MAFATPATLKQSVQVWLTPIDRSLSSDPLTPAEQVRAGSIPHPHVRAAFIASRQLLRRVCGSMCESVHTLDLVKLPARLPGHPHLGVSLAHTDEHLLLGLNPQGAIGVDLEALSPRRRWQGIARRWFAEAEWQALLALPEDQGARRFLMHWTLKEAWVKATQRGLANHFCSLQLLLHEQGYQVVADLPQATDAASPATRWQYRVGWQADRCLAIIWQGTAVLETDWQHTLCGQLVSGAGC